jgi:hypothetical protein
MNNHQYFVVLKNIDPRVPKIEAGINRWGIGPFRNMVNNKKINFELISPEVIEFCWLLARMCGRRKNNPLPIGIDLSKSENC